MSQLSSSPANNVASGGSSTDNALARWDGTDGSTLQDSGLILSDVDALVIPTGSSAGLYFGDGDTGIYEASANSLQIVAGGTTEATISTSGLTLTQDLAVTEGGTGASTAGDARTNLGLVIGTDVQAYDAQLADVAGLATTDGGFIVGNGTNFVLETGATALTSIGGIGAATTDTLTNKTFDANGTGNSLSNVDVADLANGTDGELITWDSLGAPTTVATGTSGQILTSNGAGAAPTFQTAAAATDVQDSTFRIQDDGDATKEIAFQASGITTGTVRTITMADADLDLTANSGTYCAAAGGSNLVTTGALNSGSISTGFGAIDNGTSNITTGGILKLDVDGTAENAAGSLTLGAGSDAGIFFDGVNLQILTNGAGASGIILDSEDDTVEIKGSGVLQATFDTGGLNLVLGDAYEINGTSVLNATTLGTGVTASSLTSVGTITSGTWSATDIAVASGGTGSSTAAGARTNLGLVIGTDVQAYDAELAAIAALAVTDSNFIVGNGSTWVAETGATARTSLGLGSLATASTISNTDWSGTDLSVANGGTGLSTLTDGGVLLGSGTGAITPLARASNGQLVVGSTGLDPVLATLTEGNGIDITNGAGSITIAAETATTTNPGVIELATDAEAVTGTSDTVVMTPGTSTAQLAEPPAIGGVTAAAITGTTITANTKIATNGDNDADIGDSTNAFKDIYMQGNLYFDNDNARTQDHYNWVPIASGTASASATLEFTLSSGYDIFMFVIESVLPATDGQELQAVLSPNGGSSYHTAYGRAGYYASNASGTVVSYHSTTQTGMAICVGQGNDDATRGCCANFTLYNANDATKLARGKSLSQTITGTDNDFIDASISTFDKTAAAVNYLKFAYPSGNIASGTIVQYGRKLI